MRYCADTSFGLNYQALTLLAFLSGRPPSFADFDSTRSQYKVCIQTFPWYNGSMTGVSLVIFKEPRSTAPCRVIVFGESRGSDAIVVEYWDQYDRPDGPPTYADRCERPGLKVVLSGTFARGEIGSAAEHIYGLMEAFYKDGPKLVGVL